MSSVPSSWIPTGSLLGPCALSSSILWGSPRSHASLCVHPHFRGCQPEMRAAAKSTLGRSSGHKSAPVSCAPPSSPDESRGQSAPSVPKDKNGHLLGEQKVELWLKPLCLQQQLFNPFVWCMKSVPRTQGLLITVGPFPSLQINWQKPLPTSFWMLLLFRGGK